MAESTRLVDLIQAGIDGFLDDRVPVLAEVSPDLTPFIDYSRELLSEGGGIYHAIWGTLLVTGMAAGRSQAW